jgi:aminoglycoside phosphotransferase (APT) family kinase protein
MSANDRDDISTRQAAKKQLHAVADDVAEAIAARNSSCSLSISKMISREDAVLYSLKDAAATQKVLRLSSNPHWKAKNAERCYRTWRNMDIPVPEVFDSGENCGLQFIIMELLEGDIFTFSDSTEQQVAVVQNMGTLLAAMHTVKVGGYGYLGDDGNGVFDSWRSYLTYRYTPSWIVETSHLKREHGELLNAFVADMAYEQIRPVLLHGDFKPKNMFVSAAGKVTAVIDPQPLGGDPMWDIAIYNHFIYREQIRQGKSFKDSAFTALRSGFTDAYEQLRGCKLSEVELLRLSKYECLVDAEKVEQLLRKNNELREGEGLLSYLQVKLDRYIH